MGSFAGAAPTPMLTVYSGSKSFFRTWSDALAAELAPKGVLVEHVNTYFVVRPFPPSPFLPITTIKTLTLSRTASFLYSVTGTVLRRPQKCRKSAARRSSSPTHAPSCAPSSPSSHPAPSPRTGHTPCSAPPWGSRHPSSSSRTPTRRRRPPGGAPSQNGSSSRSKSSRAPG